MSWNLLYTIDFLAFLLFAVSYYRHCYRRGYRIDFWHSQLFLFFVFPNMVMLPFARNELNALIVGRDLGGIVDVTPTVFAIDMTGFLALYVGGFLWRLRLGAGIRKAAGDLLQLGPRCSMMLMSSRDVLISLSLLCFCLQGLMLALYFSHEGFGFNLRAYTFANPGVRPLSQITALTTVVIASHCLARYFDTKEKSLLACTILLSLGLTFFGQRTTIALIFINVVLCYMVKLRDKISLLKILTTFSGLVALGLYLGNVREGEYSIAEFLASLAFLALYGNTFCDLRDFAWIYAHWDHQLWLGKTYLAGLATFVPRGLSDFRATWSFGIATDWTVGLDVELHPGLKPGLFGESFFNFGWLGAIVTGLIFGLLLRRVDIDVRAAVSGSRPSIMRAFSSTMLLAVANVFNTSLELPAIYALCGTYMLAWLLLQVRALFFGRSTGRGILRLTP